MEVIVAVIGALALLSVEMWRRRSDKRRGADAAAADRGEAYERFVSNAFNALSTLDRLVALAPPLEALPLSAPARQATRDAQLAQEAVTSSHARVRRLAPNDVAAASDALLEALRHAAELTSARQRRRDRWDQVWEEARTARIEFERLARRDTGQRSARRVATAS